LLDTETQNALVELADALEGVAFDPTDRKAHYHRIAAILKSNSADTDLIKLLKATAARMRKLSTMRTADFISLNRTADQRLASGLRALAPSAPHYIYHGTVFARLVSILEHGLIPAKRPVWRNTPAIKKHSRSAVFFATTWRGAAWWADVAHLHSRGPRISQGRRPVVLRLPSQGLLVERDTLAAAPHCLLVRGPVSIKGAEVLTTLSGYPEWKSLETAVRQ
jgi:hypothetical protein